MPNNYAHLLRLSLGESAGGASGKTSFSDKCRWTQMCYLELKQQYCYFQFSGFIAVSPVGNIFPLGTKTSRLVEN